MAGYWIALSSITAGISSSTTSTYRATWEEVLVQLKQLGPPGRGQLFIIGPGGEVKEDGDGQIDD